MTDYILLYILIVHWIADFVCQTHEQATNKATSFKWLLAHTVTYTWVWFCLGALYPITHMDTYNPWHLTYFCLITFVCHTITDFFTSKLTKKYFGKQDFHNGFVVVGFDQILHYIQLYLTFKLLL